MVSAPPVEDVENGECCYQVKLCDFCGRPFSVGGEARLPATTARDDWFEPSQAASDEPSRAREAVAAGWVADARMEHASIASFARLTLHLLALGAPSELIEASQRASLDEIEHARICFALASRFSGAPVGPSELMIDGALRSVGLAELAVATVEEGCVGETLAALLATEQLERAADAEVRRGLERIAADEASHAALSWQIVLWAIQRGGAPVREAVASAFSRALRASPARVEASREDAAFLHEHGRLVDAEVAALCEQGLKEVVGPCARALLAEAGHDMLSLAAAQKRAETYGEKHSERAYEVRLL